jgi:hypothetical protein
MKRFLLLLSPYFITCLLLATLLAIRPKSLKKSNSDSDSTKVNLNYRPEEDPNHRPPFDDTGFEPVESPDDDNLVVEQPIVNQTVIVVVGSFKKEATANQLSEKLKPAGFKSRVLKEDGLYRVVAGDYETEFDAQDDVNTLKDIGFEPWVVKN